MAEKIVADIKEFLTCVLCKNVYTQPRALPCLHTFCRTCLQQHVDKHVIQAKDGTHCVLCPRCLQICDIPQGGVSALSEHALLGQMLELLRNGDMTQRCDVCREEGVITTAQDVCLRCEDFLCAECSRTHKRTRVTREHLVMRISSMRELYASAGRPKCSKRRLTVRRLAHFGRHGPELHQPVAMVTNKADDVIVSNSNNTVTIFSLTGECKKTIYQTVFYNSEKSSLTNKGVAVTLEGYLAVAIRSEVQATLTTVAVKQTLAGREVGTCNVRTRNGDQCQPHGISVMSNNYVVVTDIGKHCLYLFDAENQQIAREGKWGSRNSQFKYPYHVTINSANDVIVADYGNHCIKVFSPKLKFKLRFGTMGSGEGELTHPAGLCTDSNDNVFVCDRDNHRMQMFSSTGEFIAIIVSNTCSIVNGGLDIRPQAVAMTSHGHLMVLLQGVEGVDWVQIHMYQYTDVTQNTSHDGASTQEATQQLYALRESLDALSMCTQAPLRGTLPPLPKRPTINGGATLDARERYVLPSAPGIQLNSQKPPDVLPESSKQGVKSLSRDVPSAVCTIL